jgi:kynurenine formamidase
MTSLDDSPALSGPGVAQWSGRFQERHLDLEVHGDVRIFDLAVRLENGMARHPHHPPFAFEMVKLHGGTTYKFGVSAAMEKISMGAHVGTHVDALGHVTKDGMTFGCRGAAMGEDGADGLDAGSIEETAPILGPGHLFDGPAFFGRDLTPADSFGPAEFESWFGDHEPLRPGAVLLVRTGWMRYWADAERYIGLSTGLPGVSIEGAHWLSERGIVASGSDTMNYEHKPDSRIINLPVHVHYLVEKGIPIMESMQLEQLAAAGATEFTFIATPLRIGGGTGSPIRPLAIVAGGTHHEPT